MKKILLLSVFLSFISQAAPLAGNYYINQNGTGDYSSITAAVVDLNANGISAPVSFVIEPGIYDENVVIASITRTGLDNDTVRFLPITPSSVVIWKNSNQDVNDNWIVRLEDAQFVKFINIEFEATNSDFQRMFWYRDETDSITIASCVLRGLVYPGVFNFESELIYTETTNSVIATNSTGLMFSDNVFELGHTAILTRFSLLPAISILNNTFINQTKKSISVSSHNPNNENLVAGNIIESSYTRTKDYLAFNWGAGGTIKNNQIKLNSIGSQEQGMSISGGGIRQVLVYNNTVSSTNPLGSSFGVKLGNYVRFLHNTVKVDHISDIALDVNATTANSVWINNNILINSGMGKAIVASSNINEEAVAELFDNNYYSAGGAFSTFGQLTNYSDITTFQQATKPKHPHIGISKNVSFVSTATGNLRLIGASIGDPLLVAHPQVEVADDIDGQTRDSINTYIGADKPSLAGSSIIPLDNNDTNNGLFYTVGGSTPDYLTPQEALDDLYRRGMKGEVTFKIRAGSYPTNANLYKIFKQNLSDLITITAANPSNHPTLTFNGDASPNFVLRFDGTSDISISSLDLVLTGSGTNGIEFSNASNTTLENNSFTGGATAVFFTATDISDNNLITNNSFDNQNINAIHLDSVTTINIDGNNVDSSAASFKGILLANTSSNSLIIQNNKLKGAGTVIGIYLDNANGEVNNRGLIANNFISTNKGIFVVNSSANWNIFHNSINTNATAITLKALTGLKPSNFDFTNNIFQTPTGVVNLRINEFETQADDNIVLNYNTYYNQVGGGILIKWYGLGFITLNSFTFHTGMDFNSNEKVVNFVNAAIGNLHLTGASIGDNELAGTNSIVITDIDGDLRATNFPYMGADEAITALSTARVQITANGNQTSEDGTQTIELSFVLLSQPSDNVAISVVSNDSNEATIDNTDIIFTPLNWSTPQLKIVNGVNDNIMEGDKNFSLSTSVVSSDASYNNLLLADISFVNIDDDLNAKLRLVAVSPMIEPSTAGKFRISLVKNMSPPNDIDLVNTQDVTINFTTSDSAAVSGVDYVDASDTIVLSAMAAFVEIDVNPIDDNLIEGTENILLSLVGQSGGTGNIIIDVPNNIVSLAIEDDDNGVIIVSNSQNLAEPSTNGGFQLALNGGISETDTEISYFLAGPPTPGVDYTAPTPTGIATIPALASSVIIPINVLDDIDSEILEVITINLTDTNNPLITVTTSTSLFAEIVDDDTSADISISITPNNPTFNTATVTNLVFTLTNNSPINIHQAVLQSTEPAGLSYVNWQCLAAAQYCSQTAGTGDISEVVSIDANSQIFFSVDVLATTTPTASLSVQAILNPAPFLTDTDPSNNTAIATSLLEIIFQNGFETSLNKQLYQAVTAFDQQDSINSHYYFIDDNSAIYHFIQIDKENNTVRYRHVYVDTINQEINQSDWINRDR